jgi:hypothetical protein
MAIFMKSVLGPWIERIDPDPPNYRSKIMVRNARVLGGAVAIALVTACSSGAGTPVSELPQPATPVVAETSDDASTIDGIFTLAQVERGVDLFESTCSECHDPVDWTEPGFKDRWEGQSVFQLWYYINDRMPYENPWSLSRQQVTDALTYILSLNDLPAGDTELATDDDSIDDYWIVWEDQH